MKKLLLIGLFMAVPGIPLQACTGFRLPDPSHSLVGKSYDWTNSKGVAVVNKNGTLKTALAIMPGDHAFTWRAAYGSLTFTQFGREFPIGGINTAGLVVETLWLTQSKYEPVDNRPTLNELQWVQYQLDNYDTVAEVLANKDKIRISDILAPVHYFVCDRFQSCAAIEALGGHLVASSIDAFQGDYPVLTNNPYSDSVKELIKGQFVRMGGANPLPLGVGSLERFFRAAYHTTHPEDGSFTASIPWALSVLDSVFVINGNSSNSQTQWNLIYDVDGGKVTFRTRDQMALKGIELSGLSFDCRKDDSTEALDLGQSTGGDVTKLFAPLTEARNLAVVKEGFTAFPASQAMQQLIAVAASYPARFTSCGAASQK